MIGINWPLSENLASQIERPLLDSLARESVLCAPPYRHDGDRGKTIARRIGLRWGHLMAVMHACSTPQCMRLAETS